MKDLKTGVVTRVSTAANGSQANGDSFSGQFTPDGSKVLFTSDATNLVVGGTTSQGIYLKDLATGALRQVVADAASAGVLSADGSKVAFISDATNLVPGDTNGQPDLFIKDLASGTVTRASVAASGAQANDAITSISSLSADGTKVVFRTEATNLGGDPDASYGWLVKDLTTGAVTALAVPPKDFSDSSGQVTVTIVSPNLSPDGTKVAFVEIVTYRTPFGPGEFETRFEASVYVQDLTTGQLKTIDKSDLLENGAFPVAAKFSPDGNSLLFPKYLSDGGIDSFADMWIADLTVDGVASDTGFDQPIDFQIAPDGSRVVFTSGYDNDQDSTDRNGFDDVYSIPVSFGGTSVTAVSARGSGIDGGNGTATVGQTVTLTLTLSQSVIVRNGAALALELNSGGRAVFDADASTDQYLYFKYQVRPDEVASDLRVIAVERNGATIQDAAGREANLSEALQPIPGTLNVNGYLGTSASETFNGTSGGETFAGKGGNDIYTANNVGDVVIEAVGGGNDAVLATVSYRLSAGQEIERLFALEAGSIRALDLEGNEFAQTLRGNNGDNILNGAGGIDTAIGELGNDTYRVDNARDVVVEKVGEGNDTLIATTSYKLAADVSIETMFLAGLTGNAALNLTGNAFDQTIRGNGGNNVLDGGGGADTLVGGQGDDLYRVDSANDRVIERAGEGRDTVETTVQYALGAGQEIETLKLAASAASADLNLIGNAGNNRILGGSGTNWLDGGAGDDLLAGKLGNDVLMGRTGRDTFVFDTKLGSDNVDRVLDFEHGTDTLQLDDGFFAGLARGELAASAFKDVGNAGAVIDADDRMIYDHRNGALYFDTNGNGAGGRTLVAILDNRAIIDHTDFLIA